MQVASDALQVVLEGLILLSLAFWGWQEGGSFGRWVIAIGVPVAIATVWLILVSSHSASKLDDRSRLLVELGIVACGAAALVRLGHPLLGAVLVLLAVTQLTLRHVIRQR